MKQITSIVLPLVIAGFQVTCAIAQDAVATKPAGQASLQKNGAMETDANADSWPDDWARNKNATWEKEGGDNHFIRMKSPAPGATVLIFQKLAIPAGAKVMEMKWRMRASDLKPGAQAWFDARIMMEFRNAEDKKVSGAPSAPYMRKSSDAWIDKTMMINVPEGATHFVFMPSLFQVETGTFDIDDISVTVVDPAAK